MTPTVPTRLCDPALPGLPSALDVDAVRDEIERSLDGSGFAGRLERVTILDVQYRPGTSCVVSYGLKLRCVAEARSRRAWLAGWLHARGGSAPSLPSGLEHRCAELAENGRFIPRLELPRLSMTAFPFPLDPALPGLVEACDPGAMRALLGRRWTERGARVRDVRIDRLGHVPGARAALALHVLGETRCSGEPEVRRLVGKMDATRDAASVFARGWCVWRAGQARVPIAPPVGFLPSIGLSLQEFVPGVRLSERAGNGSFVGDARRTASVLAALHALSLPLASRRDPAKDVRSVTRWGGLLAAIRPERGARIRTHADSLSNEIAARGRITGPLHGDLHPSNVLVDDGRVTLIDLDNMARGDSLADVGRFLSSLRTSALRAHGDAEALRPAAEAFLEAYLSRTGEDERRVRLYEAAALLVSAGSGFRLQRPGWEQFADRLLELSESALEHARRGASISAKPLSTAPSSSAAIAKGDARAWACDGRLVLSAVARGLLDQFGVDATDCKISRARDGERIHYRITGCRGTDRVRRAAVGVLLRGRNARAAMRRLEEFREALDQRRETLSIAAPLGIVPDIGLLILDEPRGERLVAANRKLPSVCDLESLGRALRALHATPIRIGRPRDAEKCRRRRLDSLAGLASGLDSTEAERIRRLVGEISNARAHTVESVSVFGRLDPRHIVRACGAWIVEGVTDVMLGDPREDVAELAAGIARLGLAEGCGAMPDLRRRLRLAYAGGDKRVQCGLGRSEAAALLRAALLEARNGGHAPARALLEAAEERLATAERCEPRLVASRGGRP